MLTHISIQNFKGIRERVELELKPITLLFGPNSAGKSSILHALLYAQEVFERHNLDADTTLAGGPFIDLGGFKNMVHGRDLDRTIGLGLRFDFEEGQWQDHELDVEAFANVLDCEPERLLAKPKSAGAFLEIRWFEGKPVVQSCQLELNCEKFARIDVDRASGPPQLCLQDLDHPLLVRLESEGIGVKYLAGEDPSRYTSGSAPSRPCSILHSALEALDLAQRGLRLFPRHDALPLAESQLQFLDRAVFEPRDIPNEKYLARKRGNMRKTPSDPFGTRVPKGKRRMDQVTWTEVDKWEEAEYRRRLASTVKEFINGTVMCVLGSLRRHLKDCRYLGPVREIPRRNAAPPSSPDPVRWSTGLGAWDHLQGCDPNFLAEVSDWLSNPNRLNAGVRLKSRELIPLDDAQQIVEGLRTERPNLKKINDVKRRLAALATERKVTLVPNDSDIELTLYDVGVGLSQLIPVVVTALDSEGRLAGIEAPEYHLHPRLQAELGDLFIESAVGKKATLLVETHSEHLVLRIQRRIRETSRGKASAERAVTTDDVAVHHLRQKKGQTLVRKIDIDKHGEFVQPWPDDFFELDFYERFH